MDLSLNQEKFNVNEGIGFFENATGSASGNTCAFNAWGINVEADANTALENNNCYNNTSEDIADKR
jgi:parallel beta-helix repeat protein